MRDIPELLKTKVWLWSAGLGLNWPLGGGGQGIKWVLSMWQSLGVIPGTSKIKTLKLPVAAQKPEPRSSGGSIQSQAWGTAGLISAMGILGEVTGGGGTAGGKERGRKSGRLRRKQQVGKTGQSHHGAFVL